MTGSLPAPFGLDGKVALVTGASRGLGWAMAQAFARAGATVVLNGREPVTLEANADALSKQGGKVDTAPFDVTDEDASRAALDHLAARHGRLDILVCNAGIQHRRPLLDFDTADFRRVIETNLTSVFVLAREAARHMIPQRSGRIIIVSSLSAFRSRPTIPAYAASKGAVTTLTRALAVELAPHGITCNAIAPGYFATEMNTTLLQNQAFDAWVKDRTPMARWGDPAELGGPAVFLASEASSFVTGQTLIVDGGMSAAM